MRTSRIETIDALQMRQHILTYFRAHVIKGVLKPDRTYEVVENDSTKLKIRSRSRNGNSIQTLFASLQTCKSLKYGQFRRVDLFWGMQHNNKKPDVASTRPTNGSVTDDTSLSVSIPGPTFLSNGELMPVDAFINRHSRKEKVS